MTGLAHRFDSDLQLNGKPIAAFCGVLIQRKAKGCTWRASRRGMQAQGLYGSSFVPRDRPRLDGISHTAEVTASSLYEAVAQGLAALRKNEWVEGIEERFGMVKCPLLKCVWNIRSKSQTL